MRERIHEDLAVDPIGMTLEVGFLLESPVTDIADVLRLLAALVIQVALQAALVLIDLVAFVALVQKV